MGRNCRHFLQGLSLLAYLGAAAVDPGPTPEPPSAALLSACSNTLDCQLAAQTSLSATRLHSTEKPLPRDPGLQSCLRRELPCHREVGNEPRKQQSQRGDRLQLRCPAATRHPLHDVSGWSQVMRMQLPLPLLQVQPGLQLGLLLQPLCMPLVMHRRGAGQSMAVESHAYTRHQVLLHRHRLPQMTHRHCSEWPFHGELSCRSGHALYPAYAWPTISCRDCATRSHPSRYSDSGRCSRAYNPQCSGASCTQDLPECQGEDGRGSTDYHYDCSVAGLDDHDHNSADCTQVRSFAFEMKPASFRAIHVQLLSRPWRLRELIFRRADSRCHFMSELLPQSPFLPFSENTAQVRAMVLPVHILRAGNRGPLSEALTDSACRRLYWIRARPCELYIRPDER